MARDAPHYIIDGVKYDRVTSILSAIAKPALAPWMAKMERLYLIDALRDILTDPHHKTDSDSIIASMESLAKEKKAGDKEKDKAGEIGSQAHDLIDWATKTELGMKVGPRPKVQDAAEVAYMAWEDWRKEADVVLIASEQTVHSKVHGYAGTLDLEATVKGLPTIVDYKTGKAVWPESFLQNWAYRMALCEMRDRSPGEFSGFILRLPKTIDDPEFEVVDVPDDKHLFGVFLAAKVIREWMK